MTNLGLFGGSFDPVHNGHLLLAECCAEQAQLDEVWFVPAANQPLKPVGPVASDEHRQEMLRLALAERAEFNISEIELSRGGVSYTVDTLRAVQAECPAAKLYFLMGADSLADFPHWHQPEEICQLATPLVVCRAGSPPPDFGVLDGIISTERRQQIEQSQVEMPATPISSSEIRELIATGSEWKSMVPAEVAEFIGAERIYLR